MPKRVDLALAATVREQDIAPWLELLFQSSIAAHFGQMPGRGTNRHFTFQQFLYS